VWWSFYRSKKKKWLARAQQVVGVCALRTESAVPPMVVGRLQGRHPKWRATLYTVGWRMSTARPQRSLGVSKKTEKPIKPRKPKKNNRKNRTVKKNRLNRLKFWKNQPVRFDFGFISKKPKKPNRTQTGKKPSQTRKTWAKTEKTEPNRFEPVFALKNRTEPKPVGLTRFRFGFGFFKKKSIWLLFFYKNRTEPKMITSSEALVIIFPIPHIFSLYLKNCVGLAKL
jgi:hypothetical protein